MVLDVRAILRNPVADALHAVAFEDLDGVVAEARFQGLQLAFITGVGAQFVDAVLRAGETGEKHEETK